MLNVVQTIAIVLMMVALVYVFHNSANAPVVFKSNATGDVCGCVVDKEYPSLGQCAQVDWKGKYELIIVEDCK
jgi:hypothetical protein